MTECEQYTIAGNDNDALVIPASLAFAKAVAKRPDLELHQPDRRHPTLIGTYLAACTTYAAVTENRRPETPTTRASIPPQPAFLQDTANETVREYLRINRHPQ